MLPFLRTGEAVAAQMDNALFAVRAAQIGAIEHPEFTAVRKQVTVRVFVSDLNDWETLEWHPFRNLLSGDYEQRTITYMLCRPGKLVWGDVEAWIELYNPAGTKYSEDDFTEVVVEYAKFGWDAQRIEAPWRGWDIPRTMHDGEPTLSYMTVRVPVAERV